MAKNSYKANVNQYANQEEAIRKANNLRDEPEQGQMLLIPVGM